MSVLRPLAARNGEEERPDYRAVSSLRHIRESADSEGGISFGLSYVEKGS
ncbi:21321_t:CDS:2 [Gigaspora margarita]|uniref:21321_t:CDS:1 n=1 Tax=Gigaspora margarita TaxID=4874 RepID=A0ABN7U5N5_GIGMA|nr:21321_t:CDS:2 [Gigaspora margarita]